MHEIRGDAFMTSLFHQADCCKDSLLEYFALLTQVLMLVRIPLLVLKYPSMKRDFQTCVYIFAVFLAMPLRNKFWRHGLLMCLRKIPFARKIMSASSFCFGRAMGVINYIMLRDDSSSPKLRWSLYASR